MRFDPHDNTDDEHVPDLTGNPEHDLLIMEAAVFDWDHYLVDHCESCLAYLTLEWCKCE